MLCPNCKTPVEGNECTQCGTILTDSDRLETEVDTKPVQRKKHRSNIWYGFLLYYAFFEVAFLNVFQGVRMLTGSYFDSVKTMERIYAEVPGTQGVVLLCALLSFAYAGLGLFTRSRLKGYRRNAPWLVLLFYTGDAVIYLFLIFRMEALVRGTGWMMYWDPTLQFQIIRSIIMVICNAIYFAKRRHLFWIP